VGGKSGVHILWLDCRIRVRIYGYNPHGFSKLHENTLFSTCPTPPHVGGTDLEFFFSHSCTQKPARKQSIHQSIHFNMLSNSLRISYAIVVPFPPLRHRQSLLPPVQFRRVYTIVHIRLGYLSCVDSRD
jgi:hypothetical protein